MNPCHQLRFGWGLVRHLVAARKHGAPAWPAPIDRKRAFLERIDALYAIRDHPLSAMLMTCGWSREKLSARLQQQDLEATLRDLAQDGVLLAADEVKCRRPLVRHGREIPFSPVDLDYVRGPSVPLGTSGTSGPRTRNPLDLDGFLLQASYKQTMLAALDASDQPLVLYYPAPSAAGIAHLLSFSLAGRAPAAWFCHLPEVHSALLPWSLRLRVLATLAAAGGVRIPLPRLAAVERPEPLVAWLQRHAPGGAVVATFPGSALRLQAYATNVGRPLPPLTFILGGEPITARKRALLEGSGHRVYPWYGAVDAGRIAIGCLAPESPDDMHLLTDRFAAIEWQGSLLLTSLLPSVHKLYLNTDCGDTARLEHRQCGCALGQLGLELHVSHVRSEQKICLEGITLPADVVHRLADEMLPAHCGGTPADYQLLEEEGADGWTRLVVRVAPELAVASENVIAIVHQVLLEAAAGAPGLAQRIRRSNVVAVRRQRPRFSPGGKLLAWDGMAHGPDDSTGDGR